MALCWAVVLTRRAFSPPPPRMRGLTTPAELAMYILDELLVQTDSHKLVLLYCVGRFAQVTRYHIGLPDLQYHKKIMLSSLGQQY